jgi:hypothetical protein
VWGKHEDGGVRDSALKRLACHSNKAFAAEPPVKATVEYRISDPAQSGSSFSEASADEEKTGSGPVAGVIGDMVKCARRRSPLLDREWL